MKTYYFFHMLCLCALAFPADRLYAQTKEDSVKRSFNALDYRLQRRYIPQGKPFSREEPGKTFSVSVMGGLTSVRGGSTLPTIYNGGIFISKDVSSFNTYRLGYIGGTGKGYQSHGAEIAHLFSLSDYLWGYKSQSHFNLSTVWGIGGYSTRIDSESSHFAAGLHTGLHAVYHLSEHFDWYIEPKVYLLTDYADGVKTSRGFDAACGILTGITYRFGRLPIAGNSANWGDNLFLEAAIGLQGDFASANRSAMSKPQIAGPAASVSIGKWFMPLGVRGTLFGGFHNTAYPADGSKRKEAYAGGRIEAMVNLNTLFKPSVTDPKWEFNLAGGYELGLLAHRGPIYAKKLRPFHGPTGAAQIVYFINEQYGIFAEARYSKSFYNQPMTSGSTLKRYQQNLSGMVGVQYRRRKEDIDKKQKLFKPYNFGYASLGANFPIRTSGMTLNKVFKEVGGQVNVGAGRQATYVSAVRAGLELGYFRSGKLVPVSINADYMLNVINLIGGYSPERIFDANAFAGVAAMYDKTKDKKFFFGLEGGLQESFKLDTNDKWSIYLEEGAQVFKGKVTSNARAFTSKGYSVVLKGSVGVKYRF